MKSNSSSLTYSASLPSHSSRTLSLESQNFEKHLSKLQQQNLGSSSGLISVKFAISLLRDTYEHAYNQAMVDIRRSSPGLNQKIQTTEAEIYHLKGAQKEAEITLRMSKARFDSIASKIKSLEERLDSLIQGQLELEHAIDQRDQSGKAD